MSHTSLPRALTTAMGLWTSKRTSSEETCRPPLSLSVAVVVGRDGALLPLLLVTDNKGFDDVVARVLRRSRSLFWRVCIRCTLVAQTLPLSCTAVTVTTPVRRSHTLLFFLPPKSVLSHFAGYQEVDVVADSFIFLAGGGILNCEVGGVLNLTLLKDFGEDGGCNASCKLCAFRFLSLFRRDGCSGVLLFAISFETCCAAQKVSSRSQSDMTSISRFTCNMFLNISSHMIS